MKVKNPTPFPFGPKVTSRRPPRPEMTLVLRAALRARAGRAARAARGPDWSPGPPHAPTSTARTTTTARASASTRATSPTGSRAPRSCSGAPATRPSASPSPSARCASRWARWSKILRVVGPPLLVRRHARRGDVGAGSRSPACPSATRDAFGGPGYARNPVGKGFAGRRAAQRGAPRRAGRSRPARRPRARRLRPDQPGLAAARRQDRQGVRRALARRSARPTTPRTSTGPTSTPRPPDQQIEGYLRGDEEVVFQNLHPTAPVFEARLPGLRDPRLRQGRASGASARCR